MLGFSGFKVQVVSLDGTKRWETLYKISDTYCVCSEKTDEEFVIEALHSLIDLIKKETNTMNTLGDKYGK